LTEAVLFDRDGTPVVRCLTSISATDVVSAVDLLVDGGS
jgi:hypothetical protein